MNTSALRLYYSDTFVLPLSATHRFPISKYQRLRERIEASTLAPRCELHEAPRASDEALRLVHTDRYINAMRDGTLTALEQRRIGFPWTPEMGERSRRSVGATMAAADHALDAGIGVNLAGGTHHSFADSGQGYCVFNDICVSAKSLQRESQIQRALVVDLDVHQGNGTASITADDPSIFTFSMHCSENFPFQKTDGDLDVALAPKTSDEDYLAALADALDHIDDRFDPDLVFYLAGADPFEGDRLGRLALTKDGIARRDALVLNRFADRQIPIAMAMAGGYANDVEDIVDIHFRTIETAANLFAAGHAES